MPQLPYSIELHDSDIASASMVDDALVIDFAPAYVHRDGKGWTQDARLILDSAVVEPLEMEYPATVSDGHMQTSRGPYHNLLHLPLQDGGPVALEIEFDSGALLRATGASVRIELRGEPTFVEDYEF